MVMQSGKSKIKASALLVSGENSLPGVQTDIFSLYPYMAEWVREPSGVSLIRTLISFMRAPPS